MSAASIPVTIATIVSLTPTIRLFRLVPQQQTALPRADAGAHIDLHLPDQLQRQYSIINPLGSTTAYEIVVQHAKDSRGGSRWLHQHAKPGDTLIISPPRNLFALQPAAKQLLFAGGIGVTPILAMARELAASHADFEVHYCVRTHTEAALLAELEQCCNALFVYLDRDGGTTLDAAAVLNAAPDGTHLYVCGPAGFMTLLKATASDCGWAAERIHSESFSAPDVTASGATSFELELARSGRRISVAADETVIAALARHGISVPVSCEQGICGTCVLPVLRGEIDHRDLFFTDAERQSQATFTPCCSRAAGELLVLDL